MELALGVFSLPALERAISSALRPGPFPMSSDGPVNQISATLFRIFKCTRMARP